MSKKYEVCYGKKISKKKLKKRFKKLTREMYKTYTDLGLTKKDLTRLEKDKELPDPADADKIMELFKEVCPYIRSM